MKKPLILFDTDMDTDCDDAGALAILLSAVRRGEASLLGIVCDAPDRYAGPACDRLCRQYGVDCPIGTLYDSAYPAEESERFVRYRRNRADNLREARQYTHVLAAECGRVDTDYPQAAVLYRRLLAGAADGSVTIVCVGLLTALDELLLSPPDEISPLSGRELVARKVDRLISMTNAAWPQVVRKNFNYDMDPIGSERVVATCPVPIHASPDGGAVITGSGLSAALPQGHPLRTAYELYNEGQGRGRSSWDLLAVHYALWPQSGCFVANARGQLRYTADELRTDWLPDGGRADREVRLQIPAEEMAARLDSLLNTGI